MAEAEEDTTTTTTTADNITGAPPGSGSDNGNVPEAEAEGAPLEELESLDSLLEKHERYRQRFDELHEERFQKRQDELDEANRPYFERISAYHQQRREAFQGLTKKLEGVDAAYYAMARAFNAASKAGVFTEDWANDNPVFVKALVDSKPAYEASRQEAMEEFFTGELGQTIRQTAYTEGWRASELQVFDKLFPRSLMRKYEQRLRAGGEDGEKAIKEMVQAHYDLGVKEGMRLQAQGDDKREKVEIRANQGSSGPVGRSSGAHKFYSQMTPEERAALSPSERDRLVQEVLRR